MKILARLLLVLAAGCVVGFSGCQDTSEGLTVEVLKKRNELVVLTDPTFYPYEYWDGDSGKIVGIDIEIANLIAAELGVRLEVRQQSFERLLPSLDSNEGDIAAAAISLTPENGSAYPHSEPYSEVCQKILVAGDCDDIKGLNDLAGRKIGAPQNTTSATFIQKLRKAADSPFEADADTRVETFENTIATIQALKNRHVDAILLDSPTAEYYGGRDSGLKVLPGRFGDEKYSFMYSKNMSKEVVDLIDRIIARIKADGTLDKFYAKHGLGNADEGG
ncbi:MAG: transporter substrate-binding domain-containing protein [Oscillospiraceae bacterium]|jgi:polar amino acid transport system substrate-binding protein|nr:transporter substrate-binding domain-containing protein [Oscillospiraceae bacterium]